MPQGLRRVPRLYRGIDVMLFRAHCQRRLRCYLKKKPDLIHGHGWLFGGMQAYEMARRLEIPLVITLHGWSLDRYGEANTPDFWPELSKANAIICQKSTAAGKLEGWGFRKDSIFQCVGPVNIPSAAVSVKLNQAANPVLCFVGRMDAMKRPQLLLEALPLIRQRLPNVLARFVGDGPMLPALKSLVARLNLIDAVEFCGWVDDVSSTLRGASVFVALSPHHNSSDLSLLEAMAHGLPVIATESPGIRDVIAHKENGLICQGEPDALAAAILTCLQSRNIGHQLGLAARDFVRSVASTDSVTELHERVYKLLIGRTDPARHVRPPFQNMTL